MTKRLASARYRRTPIGVLIGVFFLAAGCTSGGESTISSPATSTVADLASSTPGPGAVSTVPSSVPGSVPGTGPNVSPSAVSTAPAEPVAHDPVGIVAAFTAKPMAKWKLTYSQLLPKAPKGTNGTTLDVALAAPGLSTYLVFASPPRGTDRLLVGVDAASGKVRWRYPDPMATCSGPISGTAALCTGARGSDLISIAGGKRLLHFDLRTSIQNTDGAVIALAPGPDYPALGAATTPSEPNVSSAASALASATAALSSVMASGAPAPGPTISSSPATGSTKAEPQGQDASATISSYDAAGKRSWSVNARVAVNSYPARPGGTTMVVAPPGVLVTSKMVVVGSFEKGWTTVNSVDGQPAGIELPEMFGGQIDSAGRVVGTDDRTKMTTYWTADGRQLLQHSGIPTEVKVFDKAPPLYFFRQKVGDKDGLVAVRPNGGTAWTTPDDLVDGYCNGVYLLRHSEGGMETAVDGSGKKKWSVTIPGGDANTAIRSTECAAGQVIVAAESTGNGNTLAVLDAGNGRVLFTTATVPLSYLDPSSGRIVLTGVDFSAGGAKSDPVLVQY